MRKYYFDKLMKIAIPIILGNVISQLQMIIDRIFLGQVNTLYMSALGNVTSPMWTTISFCFSITTGASILISQNVGAGYKDKVEEYTSALVKWNNLPSLILFFFWTFCAQWVFSLLGVSDTVMPYCMGYMKYYVPIFLIVGLQGSFTVIMQTSNYTKPMVIYGIIRSGVNVILDYALIFGHFGLPKMGIEGAALATTIAEYVGMLFAFSVLKSDKLTTRPKLKNVIKAPIMPYIRALKLGVFVAAEDFSWNLGNMIIIRILNSINDVAAGIYSIVFSVEVLVVVIIGAVGNATMTLTGEAKGRHDRAQYKGVVKIAYVISAGISLMMLVICSIFPTEILSLFSKDQQVITGCALFLILVCINLFGKSGNIIVGSGIKGSGNTRWMLCTQIFGTVLVVSCAVLFVFGFEFGILGVFIAVLVDEGVRAIINLFKFIQIEKNWDKANSILS